MATTIYPAKNNAEAIELNISNANQFYTILQGGVDESIPTHEGNGEIPSVAKALSEAAAYKTPLQWETSGDATDLLQPRVFDGNLYVPLEIPAPFGASPDSNFWRLVNPVNVDTSKDNLSATSDPAVTDDEGSGYSKFSRWINTSSGEYWVCIDATAGSAEWVKVSLTLDELGNAALKDTGTLGGQIPTNDDLPNSSAVGTDSSQIPTNDDLPNSSAVGTDSSQIPTNEILDGRGFAETVDSVATLRASSFPANLERIYLLGYYGAGTPGGGELYRVGSGFTSADDNGGTELVDDDGVKWKRKPNRNRVSVLEFGAEQSDLGQVINDMLDAGVVSIYVPDIGSDYTYSTQINPTSSHQGVDIYCDPLAELLYNGTDAAIDFLDSDNFRWVGGDIKYDGDHTAGVDGFRVTATDGSSLQCDIHPHIVRKFRSGIHFFANGVTDLGIAYNRVTWEALLDNLYGIHLETTNDGFIGSNDFTGWRIEAQGISGAKGLYANNDGDSIFSCPLRGNLERIETGIEINNTVNANFATQGMSFYGYVEGLTNDVVGGVNEVYWIDIRNRHEYATVYAASRFKTTTFRIESNEDAGWAEKVRHMATDAGEDPGLSYNTEFQTNLHKIREDYTGIAYRDVVCQWQPFEVTLSNGTSTTIDLCRMDEKNSFTVEVTATHDTSSASTTAFYEKISVSVQKNTETHGSYVIASNGFGAGDVTLTTSTFTDNGGATVNKLQLVLDNNSGSFLRYHGLIQGKNVPVDARPWNPNQ